MQLFITYLKEKRKAWLLWFIMVILFLISFYLYHLPVKAVIYPTLLCMGFGVAYVGYDFYHIRQKYALLIELQKFSENLLEQLPEAEGMEEAAYQQIIKILHEKQMDKVTQMDCNYVDMVEYYTIWAHQIKTPIASMRLHLQNEDTPLARKLRSDLFRIEQYVEMVLTFLRLGSDSTDYVFKEYDLDEIIRSAVKKFRSEFIARKLRLNYEPVHTKILTDEKWLSFVIEQVLSNALKYTKEGTITITMDSSSVLCIKDTGIGIAPEDLPRIFEKGYTGYNGRSDKKASGIGLYLCKRVCQKLGHGIAAESVVDEGTAIYMHLEKQSVGVE